jgi:hypothetical protein
MFFGVSLASWQHEHPANSRWLSYTTSTIITSRASISIILRILDAAVGGILIEAQNRPGVVPLKAYRNKDHGYSFIYPETWHQFNMEIEGGQGVLFSPALDNLDTHLSAEVRDLGLTVTADDLPTLREGFLSGLDKVKGSKIESSQDYDVGFLIGLEARQTYREGKAVRKRWIRLLYQGTKQVRLIAQGATAKDFDYWTPVFDPAMTTFVFGDVWPEPAPGDSAARSENDWLGAVLEPQSADTNDSATDDK